MYRLTRTPICIFCLCTGPVFPDAGPLFFRRAEAMTTYVIRYDEGIDEDDVDEEVAELLWHINERIGNGSSKAVMAVALSIAMKEYLDGSEAFGMQH